jgi:hypothetical protein
MRSRSLERVVMASLGVSVVITLGCDITPFPTTPTPPPTDVVTTGPVISELLPNIGSTGGAPITIRGTGFRSGLTVSVDGNVSTFSSLVNSTTIESFAPGHAVGTVEVIVTNPDGQAGRGEFTYASPATFDFNGDWQGLADWAAWIEPFVMTIRDNMVVSVSCGASSLTLDPPPIVANGAFSFAGSGGVFITGKILSPNSAEGAINTASCPNNQWAGGWSAKKK